MIMAVGILAAFSRFGDNRLGVGETTSATRTYISSRVEQSARTPDSRKRLRSSRRGRIRSLVRTFFEAFAYPECNILGGYVMPCYARSIVQIARMDRTNSHCPSLVVAGIEWNLPISAAQSMSKRQRLGRNSYPTRGSIGLGGWRNRSRTGSERQQKRASWKRLQGSLRARFAIAIKRQISKSQGRSGVVVQYDTMTVAGKCSIVILYRSLDWLTRHGRCRTTGTWMNSLTSDCCG